MGSQRGVGICEHSGIHFNWMPRLCEKCKQPMPDAVQNRGTYNTVGSVAGSLTGSFASSAVLGSVLGFPGAIAGAISGSLVGSRAGAVASDTVCDGVEASSSNIRESCKTRKATHHRDWGG